VTVMFCDLRNFTSMSEKLKPWEVVLLLNGYFTAMTEVLFKYGATIDKYMGDSIMAFWGAPVPQEDHVQRAILASFEMQKEISNVSHLFHALNLPTPTIGIGINSGMVNVGNMGSRHRLTYTVIGDAVNLAFRLQTATRDYQVGTIVGEETATRFSDMLFRELDQVTLRGKSRSTRIYEPLCLKSSASTELKQQIETQQRALQLWYDKQTDASRQLFSQLQHDFPDQLYYQAMQSKLE
jgi:adenylate cyclase